MTTTQDRINKLVADAECAAYARGWKDATAALVKAAAALRPLPEAGSADPDPLADDERPRGRPAWAMNLVRDTVAANPGLRGVELVKSINDAGNNVAERTVRTCLRRLRKRKEIWQRNGRWYPKSKDKADIGKAADNAPVHLAA